MYLVFCTFLATLWPTISAHGRITNITTSTNVVYGGWDPEYATSSAPLPQLAAWSASNLGNIFVEPSGFNTSNITCHFNSEPGALHVNVTAGEILKLQWNEWPVSHKGPVLDYLASCSGDCKNADKEKLEWVKISELGWLNSSGWVELGGTWAADVLIENGFSWEVKIPDALEAGNYVLRHEIIALHVANEWNGAQAYPQCINLQVKRNSSSTEKENKRIEGGVVGNQLYKDTDKGILVNIHGKISGYEIPGPALWEYAERTKQLKERS